MTVVDYILIACVVIVVGSFVKFVLNLYKDYHLAQLNLSIVNLYLNSTMMTQEQVERAREVLNNAEGLAEQTYIDTLRMLLDTRERILKEQENEQEK